MYYYTFAPNQEREFLFLPGAKFRVRGWYAATQLNMRRGMRTEGESESFKLRCEHIVQPVELHVVDSDFELKKQLLHNKVVVFEMEEITMTPEEEVVEFGVNKMSEEETNRAIQRYK